MTGGQVHDSQQALPLLHGANASAFIMDAFEGEPPAAARELCKVPSIEAAYDSDAIRDALSDMDASAVIPPRSNRTVQYDYDRHVYKERHAVENFFQRIKRYRKLGVVY